MEYVKLAQKNQEKAWNIVEDMQIIRLWESIGATVNLVGSLKSRLLVKHRDIDFHIYTDQLNITESFGVMQQLAEHPRIKEITYRNLIDTEEECIEWHAWYEDEACNRWQIDIIHIRKGSRYDGVVEEVTRQVIAKLTPEIRQAILQIKYELDIPAMGVEIYRAVFTGGVRSYAEFVEWHTNNPMGNSLEWRP